MARPLSIENRWDILYRDYPEVYEAFSKFPYHPTIQEQLPAIIDTRDKVIADVGAGTGKSTFQFAKFARKIIGIEREWAMLQVAQKNSSQSGMKHVSFACGDALALPLADESVDMVTAITLALYPFSQYQDFIREGLRVSKEKVFYLGIAPRSYGGDLYDLIEDPDKEDVEVDRIFIEKYNFNYKDLYTTQDYGTVENIVSTYGFIFGSKTIEYIKKTNKTSIKWKFRMYWAEK